MLSPTRPSHDWVWTAKVVRWIDGDTAVLRIDRGLRVFEEDAVRLIGVDTPERRGRLKWGTRQLAQAALERANELAPPGSTVTIRTHKSRDKYGRWLAEIWVGRDGPLSSINRTLLDEELARPLNY